MMRNDDDDDDDDDDDTFPQVEAHLSTLNNWTIQSVFFCPWLLLIFSA